MNHHYRLVLAGVFAVGLLPLKANAADRTEGLTEPAKGNLTVLCGALIDGLSHEPLGATTVTIRKGRITSVTPSDGTMDSDQPVLDLSDHTCLPGLIDMHTHILEGHEELADLTRYYDYSLEDNLESGRKYAKQTLLAGFTTVRNLAAYYGWADRELRDEIKRGESAGPRMQASGFYLSIPGGGGDIIEVGADENTVPKHLRMGISRTTEEFARHAQEAVDGGADVLKLIASGAVLAYGGVPGEPEMTPDQIRAVVEVAHANGIRVAAHAHGAQSIREAILAGADTIEHATYIDDEGIELALEHGVALSMDVGPGDWMIEEGRRAGWVDEFLRKTIETTHVQRESFKRAHEAGVTIVYGTDAGIYPHGMNGIQFAFMVEWGMSPIEAIHAATRVSAEQMGWEDRVGSLQAGLFGDLVAVEDDPLEDIRVLENIQVVIKGGEIYKLPKGRMKGGEGN